MTCESRLPLSRFEPPTDSSTSVTYPFGIFSSTIIGQLNPNNTLIQNIGYGTVVNCFYLPGCIVGGLLMDRIGRKQTMCLGFACWAATQSRIR